jgi:hypothetical protein
LYCDRFRYFKKTHSEARLKKSDEMQQNEDTYLLLNYSTCFGLPSRPSSGIHKKVVAASGTYHTIWGADASVFAARRIQAFRLVHQGRPRRRWVYNIRMDLQEVGCGHVDWIGLAQDRDRWLTLVNAVMNLRVP